MALAIKYYRLAADQGHAWGQNNLGNCYYYGNGVGKNEKEAARLLRLSAAQGNASAKALLQKMGLA